MENLNRKIQEIVRAVESTGVRVDDVTFEVDWEKVDIAGSQVPRIIKLDLIVKFALKLEEVSKHERQK